MVAVDCCFRYAAPLAENTMRGIDQLYDVYGIRRISFAEKERLVRIEYDSTHLSEAWVAALLRRAGIHLEEKLALV
jgi:hypothetical protein